MKKGVIVILILFALALLFSLQNLNFDIIEYFKNFIRDLLDLINAIFKEFFKF